MFYKCRKSTLGKSGASIARKLVEYLSIPALQQDIRYVCGDLRPSRYREQMRRRLGAGDFDKIFVVKARGLRQDRFCHRDIVVPRETAHDFGWSIVDWSEAPAQFCERLTLDPLDEVAQYVIEHVDLLIIQAVCARNKKIGYAP